MGAWVLQVESWPVQVAPPFLQKVAAFYLPTRLQPRQRWPVREHLLQLCLVDVPARWELPSLMARCWICSHLKSETSLWIPSLHHHMFGEMILPILYRRLILSE